MDTRKQATNTDLLALSDAEYGTTLFGVAYRYERWRWKKNEQAKKRPLNIFSRLEAEIELFKMKK